MRHLTAVSLKWFPFIEPRRMLTKMVTVFLCRELGTSILRDEVAESGGLTLELARLVLGIDPVENVLLVGLWASSAIAM